MNNVVVIEGPGRVVEIDETVWIKRKCNRARLVLNQSDRGGIDRESSECVPDLVERRNAATLLLIIQRYIRPGTMVYSGQWCAYCNIVTDLNSYKYRTVNRPRYFCRSGICSAYSERRGYIDAWKNEEKSSMRRHGSTIALHLIKFMWWQRFETCPLENSTGQIQWLYSLYKIWNKLYFLSKIAIFLA